MQPGGVAVQAQREPDRSESIYILGMGAHAFRRSGNRAVFALVTLACLLACGGTGGGSREEGALTLVFRHQNDGAALEIDQLIYQNEAGNQYSVEKFEYLITDIWLIREDGRIVEVADAIQGNAVTLGAIDHPFEGVPAGRYTAIEFRWGIHPDRNRNFTLDSSFDNLLWPPNLGGGYHAMRFEGDWSLAAPGDSSFSLHSGYLRAAGRREADGSFVVRLDGFAITLRDEGEIEIEIAIDVDRWMNDPLIDLTAEWADQSICPLAAPATCTLAAFSMMNPETQELLRDNGDDVFSLLDARSSR